MTNDFSRAAVAEAFEKMPETARRGALDLRALIFQTAADLHEVGPIEEALRWGQPAYITGQSKSGTPLRLGLPKTGGFALLVHCQTSLIAQHQQMFPDADRIEGTRAILFDRPDQIDPERHGWFIAQALRYHLRD